ncbi:MAG: nitrite/sulfite reductase, partial [Dehalococcoidia bacterium]
PDQLSALAQIVKEYARGALTVTGQNIILRWVPEHALHPVWQALSQLGLAETGRDGITDVVGCSSEYCRLHITRALSAGQAIREALLSVDKELLDDPLINKMHIHIGGCPRACSQYAEGDIGFHGSVITVKGHHAPAYELFVGGSREPAHYRLAQAVGVKVVAKRAPEVVKRILDSYRAHRQVDETFTAFVDRVGVEPFKELAEPFAQLPPLSPETQDLYMDWEATEPFSVVVKRQKGWDAGS